MSTQDSTPELTVLLEQIRARTESPEVTTRRYAALQKWMIETRNEYRVFCLGKVYLRERFGDAALVYDLVQSKVIAMAPMGDDDMICEVKPAYFHSNIPYAGISQEVLSGNHTV